MSRWSVRSAVIYVDKFFSFHGSRIDKHIKAGNTQAALNFVVHRAFLDGQAAQRQYDKDKKKRRARYGIRNHRRRKT